MDCYEEDYQELRRWLQQELDRADAAVTEARHTANRDAELARRDAILEYNRRKDALRLKYARAGR